MVFYVLLGPLSDLSVGQVHGEAPEGLAALPEAAGGVLLRQEYLVTEPIRHLKLILTLVSTSTGASLCILGKLKVDNIVLQCDPTRFLINYLSADKLKTEITAAAEFPPVAPGSGQSWRAPPAPPCRCIAAAHLWASARQ